MRVVVMEPGGKRLSALAASWGVRVVEGQAAPVTAEAIATAYRREVEAEERRAMHERAIRAARERAASSEREMRG